MICPCRHGVKFDVAAVNGKVVITSQEEYFPECYEGDCPYYDYIGACKAIDRELEDS